MFRKIVLILQIHTGQDIDVHVKLDIKYKMEYVLLQISNHNRNLLDLLNLSIRYQNSILKFNVSYLMRY